MPSENHNILIDNNPMAGCQPTKCFLPLQPSLTLDKDSLCQERPSRPSRHHKKKQKHVAEPELSESDEYADFTEQRQETITEFHSVIVGDETETSSAVQSIQQVNTKHDLQSIALLVMLI